MTAEIQAIEASPPPAVPAPNESAEESPEIELLLAEAQSLEATIKEARIERTLLSQKRTTVDQALQNLRNLERRVRDDLKTIDKTLRGQGSSGGSTNRLAVAARDLHSSLETEPRAEADSRCAGRLTSSSMMPRERNTREVAGRQCASAYGVAESVRCRRKRISGLSRAARRVAVSTRGLGWKWRRAGLSGGPQSSPSRPPPPTPPPARSPHRGSCSARR